MTSPKNYWSIIKTFLENKKIPCIPPLLHDDKFITNLSHMISTQMIKICDTSICKPLL